MDGDNYIPKTFTEKIIILFLTRHEVACALTPDFGQLEQHNNLEIHRSKKVQ